MQTSGLILDVYDDVGGEQLRSFFPTRSDVPGFIKSASVLSAGQREQLPDDVFALVLLNGEEKLRKYACIDEGNTVLSVLYFVKNAHKLPNEARATAAENLKVACGWYGLDVPEEIEKEASGNPFPKPLQPFMNQGGLTGLGSAAVGTGVIAPMVIHETRKAMAKKKEAGLIGFAARRAAKDPLGTVSAAMTAGPMYRGTSDAIKENIGRVHAGEDAAGVLGGMHAMEHRASANLEYLQLALGMKVADVSGTVLAPISKDNKSSEDNAPQQTIKKTAGRLVPGHRSEKSVEPEVNAAVPGKMPLRAPQHMNPVVDVTGKSPEKEHKEKKASRFALPSYGRYPLDTYGQVKQASSFFEEYGRRLTPVDRHEYCVNLVKRASELLIPVSDTVKKYGSEKYAEAHEFSAALETRRQLIGQDDAVLLDKIASAAPTLEPEDFASILSAFDQSRGLQHHYDSNVMDPYYSTFGFQKRAEDDENWSDVIGNHVILGKELKTFALNGWTRLTKQFGLDFAEEFRKDPIGIFNSMPVEQKVLIIRLATENSPL